MQKRHMDVLIIFISEDDEPENVYDLVDRRNTVEVQVEEPVYALTELGQKFKIVKKYDYK